MPNTPESDLQVENETVEPYRGVMIFRTLQTGKIVGPDGSATSKPFPPQTFYATLTEKQRPKTEESKGLYVSRDVEGVRALIDSAVPGTGLIAETHPSQAKESAKAA
jgi:hypothetical protein